MLTDGDIKCLINDRYVKPVKELNDLVIYNKKEIEQQMKKTYDVESKEHMLLHFRRAIEMLIKSDLLLTVTALSNNELVAVRKENFLQLVDDRYYSTLQLSSFMDIFKIETKDFKCISNTMVGEPHIGLVINYILEHFTNTFTRFMNRNAEYYHIYEFFYKYGVEIKKVLSYLNAYHYNKDEEWEGLYNVNSATVQCSIDGIFEEMQYLLDKKI